MNYNSKIINKEIVLIIDIVCVSAVVPYRSRVLSPETKTLNEDKTLNQLVTAPLQKHFVGSCLAFTETS